MSNAKPILLPASLSPYLVTRCSAALAAAAARTLIDQSLARVPGARELEGRALTHVSAAAVVLGEGRGRVDVPLD